MDEELLSRQMPYSAGGEQAVIAAMLKNMDNVTQVITQLRDDDFYLSTNRDAYYAIFHLYNHGERVDMVMVRNQMMLTGRYKEEELVVYMETLTRDNISSSAINSYVEIVKDKSMLRKISQISEELNQLVFEGTSEGAPLLELAEQKYHALRQGKSDNDLKEIAEVLHNTHDHLHEKSLRGNAISGHSTGLVDLDKAISGLKDSDLILLAARPGMGKTSMALNMLLHVGKYTDKAVVFFSLEMNEIQLALRLIAQESFVDSKRLTSGQLTEKDWFGVKAACSALLETRILVSDNPFSTVADIKSKCRRVDNLGLVIIDYLQLMQAAGGKKNSGENRQQVVSDISRALKIMSKELNVPVLCLSQLSRANESRSDKRPMLSDLRESGAIEQDADVVMFLYREDYYDKDSENHNVAECIIAKNRRGETGTVQLQWLPEFTTFSSLERRYQDDEG